MKLKTIAFLLLVIPLHWISGQSNYHVEKTGFSRSDCDEFSPAIIGDTIVYCSNYIYKPYISFQTQDKRGLFNIYSSSISDTAGNRPMVFSRNIETPYNEGPASFSSDGKKMVYSRNIDAKVRRKNMVNMRNMLGLFFAELINNEWSNISGFEYNDSSYSISTPCFSPDGRYLYFCSDMPGGYGGMDIYRTELVGQEWAEPENLGNVINTTGTDAYPYIASNGDLYFASDGHGGLGNKDVFQSKWSENGWMKPRHLLAPINSEYDDFGFITDSELSAGYFSSNRDESDDIYKFSTLIPQLFDCDTLIENQYCFEFWDDMFPGYDSLPVIYEWEFSDGFKVEGLRIEHCFPGAGAYWAKLKIIDNSTGETFFTQSSMEFEIEDFEQPFIASRDTITINEGVKFDGMKSNLPGFTIEEYIWDFGDGTFATGSEHNHIFGEAGIYYVKLGVSGYEEGNSKIEIKCVTKPIVIISRED